MSSDRVLLVLKNYLGDTVMATPLLDGLLKTKREVGIVSTPMVRDLLTAPNRPFEFIAVPSSHGVQATRTTAEEMRKGGYGLALVVNRSFRSALLVKLAGVETRVGHATEGRSFLLTHPLPYDLSRNEAECYLDLARCAGVELPWTKPGLYVSEGDRTAGKALLDGAEFTVQPGARHPWKKIPTPVLARALRCVYELGLKAAFIGGKEEISAGAELLKEIDFPVVDLIGKTSIRETLGILSNCRLALGGDTGVMHLAVGVGCPTLVAFSAVKPVAKWAHEFAPHRNLRVSGGDLSTLTPEAVSAVVAEMLAGT